MIDESNVLISDDMKGMNPLLAGVHSRGVIVLIF
jgi:hypothetical protein